MLVNKSIPLKNRARIYCACVRAVMLYGADTWAKTKAIEKKICSCTSAINCMHDAFLVFPICGHLIDAVQLQSS